MPDKTPTNTEEAIWDIHARMVSLETTIRGTPNTAEQGLVGELREVKDLAVEVKNYYISLDGRLRTQEAKCEERSSNESCKPDRKYVVKVGGISGAAGLVLGAVVQYFLKKLGFPL